MVSGRLAVGAHSTVAGLARLQWLAACSEVPDGHPYPFLRSVCRHERVESITLSHSFA